MVQMYQITFHRSTRTRLAVANDAQQDLVGAEYELDGSRSSDDAQEMTVSCSYHTLAQPETRW